MRNWFMQASILVKSLIIATAALVAISLVAIPTALITVSLATQSNRSVALPSPTHSESASKTIPSISPSSSKSPTSGPSTSPNVQEPSSSKNNSPSQQEVAPDSSAVQAPAPAPAPALAAAPTGISLGGRGCATGLDGSGNCGTSVYFTAPSDTGSGPITGYQIGYSTNGGATWGYVNAVYNPTPGQPDWDSGPTLPADPANLLISVRAVTAYGAGASSTYVRFQ